MWAVRRFLLWSLVAGILGCFFGCSAAAISAQAAEAEGGGGEASAPLYSAPEAAASEPPLGELTGCPSGASGEGEVSDESAREVRALRSELAASCAAVTQLLQAVAHRSWWTTAQLLADADQAHGDATSAAAERAEALAVARRQVAVLESLEASASESPASSGSVEVTNAAAIATPVAESVDADGEMERHALWFLAGCLVCGVVGYGIYRTGSIR